MTHASRQWEKFRKLHKFRRWSFRCKRRGGTTTTINHLRCIFSFRRRTRSICGGLNWDCSQLRPGLDVLWRNLCKTFGKHPKPTLQHTSSTPVMIILSFSFNYSNKKWTRWVHASFIPCAHTKSMQIMHSLILYTLVIIIQPLKGTNSFLFFPFCSFLALYRFLVLIRNANWNPNRLGWLW